jgi:LPS-assembly protein
MTTLKKTLVLLISLAALSLARAERMDAEETDSVRLDADRISYEESTGVAIAEGSVRINDRNFRVLAPYLEYDSNTQQVTAISSREGGVTFLSDGKRLTGERLEYNINTRRGTLTLPNGKADSFYVKGSVIRVIPAAELGGRKSPEELEDDSDEAAIWSEASLTTCNDPHPHYRLEAKEVTVIPGRKAIIKRPKVYLGDTPIFVYPFDYVIELDSNRRRSKHPIFPKLGYESGKGEGIGLSGAFGWDGGELGLEAIAWTRGIWEGEALLTQEIGSGLSLYGAVRREYDKDSRVVQWRPRWGVDYGRNGWKFEAGWSERELVHVEKRAGTDSRYVIWRKPEINIVSPWFKDAAAGGCYRLFATWGRYEEAAYRGGTTVERVGAGAQAYGEFGGPSDRLRPFYNIVYWHFDYDGYERGSQRLLDSAMGVRWNGGRFDMQTAYLRRWVWGGSPMRWDDYSGREEIYQDITYSIPTGANGFEWKAGIRAAYDVKGAELAELVYKISYDQHCLLWGALYRDDRIGGDDWFGLTLTIKEYPSSGIRLMGVEPRDPARAPDALVP